MFLTHYSYNNFSRVLLDLTSPADAIIRLDLDSLLDKYGMVSYWRLIEAAARVFHLYVVEHITLFYVSSLSNVDNATASKMQMIANDVDLSLHLESGLGEDGISSGVHRIRVNDSTVLISKPGE